MATTDMLVMRFYAQTWREFLGILECCKGSHEQFEQEIQDSEFRDVYQAYYDGENVEPLLFKHAEALNVW